MAQGRGEQPVGALHANVGKQRIDQAAGLLIHEAPHHRHGDGRGNIGQIEQRPSHGNAPEIPLHGHGQQNTKNDAGRHIHGHIEQGIAYNLPKGLIGKGLYKVAYADKFGRIHNVPLCKAKIQREQQREDDEYGKTDQLRRNEQITASFLTPLQRRKLLPFRLYCSIHLVYLPFLYVSC